MTMRKVNTNLKKGKKFVIDATDQTIGRLSTKIAMILIGKNNVNFQPDIDINNRVVVINAEKARFSGKKLEYKEYKHHSMRPGGLKRIPAKIVLQKNPKKLIEFAVNKMLPKNNTRRKRILRLSFK